MTRRLRLFSRVHTFAVMAGVATAVYSGLTQQWEWLGASVFVVVAGMVNSLLVIAAALGCVVVGAWPALAAAGVMLLAETAVRVRAHYVPDVRTLDIPALAKLVRNLPPSLMPNEDVVTTAVLLRAAVADDQARWRVITGPIDAPANAEGGIVAGTKWTVVAAEAVLVAAERPRTGLPLDIHTLAAFGVILPNSLAQHAIIKFVRNLGPALTVLGVDSGGAVEMLTRAADRPGGEYILRRTRYAVSRGIATGALLDDVTWARLSPTRSRYV